MDIQHTILLAAALLNVGLSILILSRDWRQRAHQFFSMFAFSIGAWAITLLLFDATGDEGLALVFIKGAYIAAALIGPAFFAFAVVFPIWFFRYARRRWMGFDHYWDPA